MTPDAGRHTAILQVSGLTKVYAGRRGKSVTAVDQVSFAVARNEIVGLLGPNGAGKTTTIKCIATLIRPTAGRIEIDGVDALRRSQAALTRVAAVLEGNRNIYWRLTVRDNLQFFAGLQGLPLSRVRGQIDELITRFQLTDKVNTQARSLSRGMQQKLAVACALVRQTPLLLLDEPTLGLDVEASHDLRQSLKQMADRGERTIVLSSHDMNVVQDICERVIIINQGRVVVDDRVANLKRLFTASGYRFVVGGHLTADQEARLRARVPVLTTAPSDHTTTIEADVMDEHAVYDLIDILRSDGLVLQSVGRQDPHLEEIFLRIVKGAPR